MNNQKETNKRDGLVVSIDKANYLLLKYELEEKLNQIIGVIGYEDTISSEDLEKGYVFTHLVFSPTLYYKDTNKKIDINSDDYVNFINNNILGPLKVYRCVNKQKVRLMRLTYDLLTRSIIIINENISMIVYQDEEEKIINCIGTPITKEVENFNIVEEIGKFNSSEIRIEDHRIPGYSTKFYLSDFKLELDIPKYSISDVIIELLYELERDYDNTFCCIFKVDNNKDQLAKLFIRTIANSLFDEYIVDYNAEETYIKINFKRKDFYINKLIDFYHDNILGKDSSNTKIKFKMIIK